MTKTKKFRMRTCPICGHKYRPRKEKPKACPGCKQYFDRPRVKKPITA
jgi:rubrerythrin